MLLGGALIGATSAIHAGFMMVALHFVRHRYTPAYGRSPPRHPTVLVALFVLWMFLASIVEIWLWSGVYLFSGLFETLEQAVYFSTVTFTTLGYGDIVLSEQWRLLASFQAANGIILFGWTTALVFAVVSRLYFRGEGK